jgi:hypothetical protein
LISDRLKDHKDSGAPKPEDIPREAKDTVEYQLGYRLGWHHGLEDAVEIAEEVEDD